MKLKKLLQQPQFKQIKVINDDADLSKNVTTVVMMEAPDISDFIVEGQLLVTIGYHFNNNIGALIDLIKIMKQRGRAIGIKEHRYLKKIPQAVIDVADQYHFPILLIPDDVRLSVLVRNILHAVLEQQTDQLTQVMDDTLTISKYILAHRSDNEILTRIAHLLKCDVFIIDAFGRRKAQNEDAKVDPELFDYTANKTILIDLDRPTRILNRYMMYPLKNTNKLMRRFVIFDQHNVDGLGQRLLIENMVNLLSLESMQVSINVNETRQRKSEVFETILSQQLPEKLFASSLKLNGLNIDDQYQAMVIDEANSIDTGDHQSVMHEVTNYVYWYFNKVQIPIIVINWQFKLCVLVKTEEPMAPILNDLNKFLMHIFPKFRNQIGYTSNLKPLIQFKKSLNEADEALQVAKREHLFTPNQFQPQHVNDILSLVPKKESDMFIDSILGPILKVKPDEQKQLIELLVQYFADNQSISKAANDLFIHRNTAVYRMKKLEKLLHMDLHNGKDNEQLRLATKLYLLNY
ncbi:PucR family transcriptional regulator [Lactobacillaceae bacterium Melli_B3]